ncbi:acyl-CoA thioesterase [Haloactinomyces albus]|uniref:YbgC/YbaW family acyl-CoA thioester hydrolase n=1 Tax=Haloactinomyces albus TaxID=1352928 RepID=A0AAE4CN59_9ACTN|nr:thioesterase family protein [Haloactinomyces albus]MDR7303564.1 YbgC/YbaW family acyl-CoA thioester hydrolase [Haloactinomyces albus]
MSGHGHRPTAATITRRVQWPDTDASGHQHHSVVMRWAEEAEAALLDGLGLADQFGHTPRVRYQVDYRSRLWFGDRVEVELAVAQVGRSSLTYHFRVHGPLGCAAEGEMTIVHTGTNSSGSVPWPEATRAALMGKGRQPDEGLSREGFQYSVGTEEN